MSRRQLDGYDQAHSGAVWIDRSGERVRRRVDGRAPRQMLDGILSGTMPPDDRELEPGILGGRAFESTVLTPKGKLITVVRVLRMDDAFLLDLPAAGAEPLAEHFGRYLPPRMARVHERSDELGHLTVVGPDAARLLSREALGLRVDAEALEKLDEGELRVLVDGSECGIRVVRSAVAPSPSFEVIAERATIQTLRERLGESGAAPGDSELAALLRMERGRPEFGVDIDRDTLPPEAGLDPRAIDHHKGCYTGQEVIVRIRDRGRVNRHLRGLLLGDLSLPEPGSGLWIEGRDRTGGEVRSAAYSPRLGQGIALAMVRREAEPPTTVRLGSPDGPPVGLRALDEDGWVLEADDRE